MLTPRASRSISAILAFALLFLTCLRVEVLSQSQERKDPRSQAEKQSNQPLSQKEATTEAIRFDQQANELYEQGKYDAAILLEERALTIVKDTDGTDSPNFARLLSHLASMYLDKGDFSRAEENGRRALAIQEKTLAVNDLDIADTLNMLGLFYYNKGDFTQAEQMSKRALKIREEKLASNDPLVAQSLNALAILYMDTGDLVKAEQMSKRALEIFEKALGSNHYLVALTLHNLGTLYGDMGKYALAQQMLQEALTIVQSQETLGANHLYVAGILNSNAILFQKQGDYTHAEQMFQKALIVAEKALGTNHPQYAFSLSNFAQFYLETGNYVRAEQLFQSALEIQQKAFGTMIHPNISLTLNNLALLYRAKGDFRRAQQNLLQSLEIIEKTLGANHPRYALGLFNLASLYQENGEFPLAEQIFENVLGFYIKLYGNNNHEVATILNNIGLLYFDKGDYNKAEGAFGNALDISIKVLGADHPEVAITLNNLAGVYEKKGDYLQAEQFDRRALEIREKAFGANHPILSQSLDNLTGLYLVKGDIKKAVLTQTRSNDIYEHNLALMLTVGSEIQKLLYMHTLASRTDGTISLHLHSAPANLDAARLALTTILRRKGRALDAMTDQVGELRRRLNPQDNALLDELSAVNSQLSAYTFRRAGQANPMQFREAIAQLGDEKERLEARVSSRSAEFRTLAQPLTLERVQRAIPTDATLIEMVSYRHFNPNGKTPTEIWGKPHYAAYVLRREGEPVGIDLGEAAAIDQAVVRFRAALADPKSTDVKQLARALDELVMRPVRKLLGETHTVLLSPDGQLNLVPFAALVDEQGRYLVENYTFDYLTSGRDLLRLDAQAQSRQQPVVIANPSFDVGVTTNDRNVTGTGEANARRSIDFKAAGILPLPGTAQEAAAIKSIVPSAQLFTERAATEAALKHVAGPRFLHIATHGFFQQDQPPQTADLSRRFTLGDATQTVQGENPLLRSGLVLAGVSKGQSGAGEDGVVTSLEVAGLDLWGTKLVVLSACDTGNGDVKKGEGVYGLRRALVLAGAESQLMSLWQVSDKATRDLMIDYYRRLERGEGRTEALRAAQLEMLAGNKRVGQAGERRIGTFGSNGADYGHPYYWASFIPIGDWRPINRSKPVSGEELLRRSVPTLTLESNIIAKPPINLPAAPRASASRVRVTKNPTDGRNTTSFETQMRAAADFYKSGNLSEAASYLQRALALKPNDVDALTAMGNVKYDAGDFLGAASFYQRSLALRPNNAEVRADLGNTYFYRASPAYNAALTEYQAALKISPKDERVWQNIIVTALFMKNGLIARDAINQLAEINPSNPNLAMLRSALASLISVGKQVSFDEAMRLVTMHK